MNNFFRTQFHQQCDYLFKFHTSKKISESILLKNWPRNESNKEDDAYEIPTFAYNQKMDQLMLENNLSNNEEEEPRSPSNLEEGVMEMDDEEETVPTGK